MNLHIMTLVSLRGVNDRALSSVISWFLAICVGVLVELSRSWQGCFLAGMSGSSVFDSAAEEDRHNPGRNE